MGRTASETLTAAELRVMEALWQRGSATVADIQADLRKQRRTLAYTTILTTLQVLEGKGIVGHEPRGKAYVYHPLIARDEGRRTAVRDLLKRWFHGSPNALLVNLIEEELSDDERDELRQLLRKKK